MKTIIYFALLFTYVCAQNMNEIKDDLQKKLEEIPGIDQLNSSLPNAEDIERLIREKCEKNGADPSLVDDIKNQQDLIQECVTKLVDGEVLQAELQEAKKTGSMDEVFGKYCNRYPEVYACIENVTDSSRQCMDQQEVIAFNKSLSILKELKEFICYKDGDRIAMFVAEGGYECLTERKEALQTCVNQTVGARIPVGTDFSVSGLPSFIFSERDCDDFDTIRNCVNVEMVKCKNSTPANVVDTFFKFLKKQMPCTSSSKSNPKMLGTQSKSASSKLYSGSMLLITMIIYAVNSLV